MKGLKAPGGICSAYVLIGIVWIWGGDALLREPSFGRTWMDFETANGVLFVLASGTIIALLLQASRLRLRGAKRALQASYDQSIRALVSMLDAYHSETHDHSQRVARMTVALARLAGITDASELKRIEFGALLHDVGKLVVPDAILSKRGPLTDAEMAKVREHPDKGRMLLERIDFLRPCVDIPYCHHEQWDGGGYPRGLRGEQIPFAARLFSVIDVWDALIHLRVYKDPWSEENVRSYLAEQSGKQFDPDVVRLFLAHYERVIDPERETSRRPIAAVPAVDVVA